MHLLSLNLGQPQLQIYAGEETLTGGHKQPVPAALLRATGFDGDAQADRRNHGGPDKAACVYAFDHYPYWEQVLGQPLPPGSFSENLTIASIRESEVCVGDVFRIGHAVVQISQPRQPCFKLAGRHARPDLGDLIHANSFSGFYFRVLEEGPVKAGDSVALLTQHPLAVTVEFANQVMYRQRPDSLSLQRVLDVDALSKAWRKTLLRRITNNQ